ncbi:uncharacterized protein LOC128745460 [Sabethes cyaneus]|uniref:uncharacterized protein LOC128745460 n=1 Tax=Sabethes cyaneus TaxID=53552 RepID=UPI00237E100D|nr:uncharacterized protein LOC128745460 [Sabethes cyaneus]
MSQSNQHLPEPVCGQVSLMLDNCFHNTTPKVAVDLLYTVKIPESAEEINARCMVFNRGMDCVQHYLNTCIDSKERKIIENEVYGARKLYGYLCRDKSFQREFLKHKACFHYMHNDWDSCSRNFISILKEEMARTTQQSFNVQYMHFCCARYGYESCVFNSASYKCKLESAVFLKKIAKLLSTDRHFLNCDRLENELCSAGPQGPVARMPLLLVATVPLLWLLLPLLMGTSGCYGRLV